MKNLYIILFIPAFLLSTLLFSQIIEIDDCTYSDSKLIPYLGKYIVGKSEPYEYLVNSIKSFYNQEELLEIIKSNGFEKVEYRNLSGGIASIHSGWKI